MAPRRRLQHRFQRMRHSLIVGLALVGYLTQAVGIPLPIRANQAFTTPFPCQNHSCGCQSAEQCWQHCCCFSMKEKLAWAKVRHVTPPPYIQTEAAQGWNAQRQRDREAESPVKAKSCCGHCADKTEQAPARIDREPAEDRDTESSAWVLGMSARHCQGLGSLWNGSAPSLPAPTILTWHYDWAPAAWISPSAFSPTYLILPPPAPPPRS
jgi:hypothetical protein